MLAGIDYVKGAPVDQFEPGRCYLIELWASWCGPCRATIPHLTALQAKHSELTIVGVAIWERDPAFARALIEEMGDAIGYTVAVEKADLGGGYPIRVDWADASYTDAVPTAFLIDGEGRIAWLGNPNDVGFVLMSVLDGSHDRTAAAETYRGWLEENLIREERALIDAARSAIDAGDPGAAIAVYGQYLAAFPGLEHEFGMRRLGLMLTHRHPEGLAYAAHLAAITDRDPKRPREVLREITDLLMDRDDLYDVHGLAGFCLDTSALLPRPSAEDSFYLSWYEAIALFRLGRAAEAVEVARTALAAGTAQNAPDDDWPMANLRELIARIDGTTLSAAEPAGPEVVCEGDVCRIVS